MEWVHPFHIFRIYHLPDTVLGTEGSTANQSVQEGANMSAEGDPTYAFTHCTLIMPHLHTYTTHVSHALARSH